MPAVCLSAARWGVGLLAALAVSGSAAKVDDQESFDRFRPFNECGPMRMSVAGNDGLASDIGLSMDSLQSAVESRIRSAGLYSSDKDVLSQIYLFVSTTDPIYRINL